MAKVFYEDILVGEVLTNRSLTVEEALDAIGFDEEKFIEEQGFEAIKKREGSPSYQNKMKRMIKMTNFKTVGAWWNDKSIELVEIDGEVYALNGWNGEQFNNCWKCTGEHYMDASEEEYVIIPDYEEVSEDEFEIVGYEVR